MSARAKELADLLKDQVPRIDRTYLVGTKGRLKSLAEQLREDEAVLYVAIVGTDDKHIGVLAVTDQRLLVRGGIGGKRLETEMTDLPLFQNLLRVRVGRRPVGWVPAWNVDHDHRRISETREHHEQEAR